MKRSFYAVLLLVYVLVCCTVTSIWVEQQMTLTGRVTKLGRDSEIRNEQVPLWKAWKVGSKYHLFQVVTETDSNGVVRDVVREIPSQDFSITPDGKIETFVHGTCRILHAASRLPKDGEAVVILKAEPQESRVLVWNAHRKWMSNPVDQKNLVLGYARSDRLVQVTQNAPFLEKEQIWNLYAGDDRWEALRAIDLTDVDAFLENLPTVCAAACLVLLGLAYLLWAWLWNRRLLLLPAAFAPVGVWLLLRGCSLPSSLLPKSNILSLSHYRSIFKTLRQTDVAPAIQPILQNIIHQTQSRCSTLVLLTLVLIMIPAIGIAYKLYR